MSGERRVLLSLKNIDKSFPGVKALNDVSLELYENEILGICGENGAGKSTLLKVFSGVYTADKGTVLFDGQERHFKNPSQSIRAGISIIHQELSYVNDLSVAENIFQGRLPMKHGFIDWKRLYGDAQRLLDENGIGLDAHRTMRDLPMALKQLVEIIKAISGNAKVVVMDEPTSSLGLEDVKKLMEIVRHVAARGISFIFVSHRLEELFEICHRIVVMRDGEAVGEFERGSFDQMSVVSKMVGRKVTQLYPKEKLSLGDVVLGLDGLCAPTLHDVSLQVRAGEIAGLYGMAGAGQDDILGAVFGMITGLTGTITVNGRPLNVQTPAQAIREGLAYVTAERKRDGLILAHSVNQNIVLADLQSILRKGFINYACQRDTGEKWVKELGIKTPSLETQVDSLSGGNQQKVVMAKWLRNAPRVLLLNEPTRGVDVGAKQEIFKIVQDMCKQGMAVLMITSDMMEMLSMADTIYTVCGGRITARYSQQEATQIKLMLSAIDKTEEAEKHA